MKMLVLLLLVVVVVSCEEAQQIGSSESGSQEVQCEAESCLDSGLPPSIEPPVNPEIIEEVGEVENCVTQVTQSFSAQCETLSIDTRTCPGDQRQSFDTSLEILCEKAGYRCEEYQLSTTLGSNGIDQLFLYTCVDRSEASEPLSSQQKVATNLYRDFLGMNVSDSERDLLAQDLENSGLQQGILNFLNRNDVKRRRVAQWYREIWFESETVDELVAGNKINSMLNKYNRGEAVIDIVAEEYYSLAYHDRSHLDQKRRDLGIGIPFGVLWYDYTWVWMLYPGVHQKTIDGTGARFYSQIANNYSKRDMAYVILNHNNGEAHLAVAAKWHFLYLRKNNSMNYFDAIAELKEQPSVQSTASLMNNSNYRDMNVLASLLSSPEYLETYK